jgi:hypothetical protein
MSHRKTLEALILNKWKPTNFHRLSEAMRRFVDLGPERYQ